MDTVQKLIYSKEVNILHELIPWKPIITFP
jgi:hypothetical protein